MRRLLSFGICAAALATIVYFANAQQPMNIQQLGGNPLNLGPQSPNNLTVTDIAVEQTLGKMSSQLSALLGEENQTQLILNQPLKEPCLGLSKFNVAVSTSANVQLVAGMSGKALHICGGVLIGTTAGNFSIVEGTGATCGTGTAAVIGGTTAAAGVPTAANGGFLLGNGSATTAQANGNGTNLCLLLTGTGQIAGNMLIAY